MTYQWPAPGIGRIGPSTTIGIIIWISNETQEPKKSNNNVLFSIFSPTINKQAFVSLPNVRPMHGCMGPGTSEIFWWVVWALRRSRNQKLLVLHCIASCMYNVRGGIGAADVLELLSLKLIRP